MTSASLKDKSVRDLARLAKQHGVAGWHAMRKDQLIRALVRKARTRQPVAAAARTIPLQPTTVAAQPPRPRGQAVPRPASSDPAAPPRPAIRDTAVQDPAVAARLQEARERLLKA
ncbi:MAG: Rho termination factor N-terminal domain-containing protein, partial [Planctomycetia bacterium]